MFKAKSFAQLLFFRFIRSPQTNISNSLLLIPKIYGLHCALFSELLIFKHYLLIHILFN